ncbi:MAG: hypothetical protein PVF23_00025 [Chromatiales bacterium]
MSDAVTAKKAIWRDPKGRLPNTIALIYAVPGHLLGLRLLVESSALLVIPALLLTARTMVIGAYLVHECGHMTLFRSKKINARMAEILLWLPGGASAEKCRIFIEGILDHLEARLRVVFGGACHVIS